MFAVAVAPVDCSPGAAPRRDRDRSRRDSTATFADLPLLAIPAAAAIAAFIG
jgi:hypothetical protein